MTEENLDRIIIKLIEEKPNLRISGGEKLHPIYEAVLALLKQQFSDERIMEIIESESDLRKVLALDSIVDYIPSEKREQFMRETRDVKDYAEILNKAALYIAENKRVSDGKVLHPVSEFEMQKYFLKAIKKANPNEIYLTESIVPKLEKKAEKIKRRKTRRIVFACILSSVLGLWAYNSGGKTLEYLSLLSDKNRLENELADLYRKNSGLEEDLGVVRDLQKYDLYYDDFNKNPDTIIKKLRELESNGNVGIVRFFYSTIK